MNLENIKNKIENRTLNIGIIGLGYVGLPLAMEFLDKNYKVFSYDISEEKINNIKHGRIDYTDVDNDKLSTALLKNFKISSKKQILREIDIAIICVPTPLTNSFEPDISYITEAMDTLLSLKLENLIIVLESTTYPGTTREILLHNCLNQNYILDKNLLVAYSPERVDPGNLKFQINNTPKIVGGISQKSTYIVKMIYNTIIEDVILVSTPEVAEMSKLLENTFRSVNIAFVNEMMKLSESLNIDIWETLDASGTKPFGFMKFLPGPGIGGHCIPLDPMYLYWKGKINNNFSKFIELSHQINCKMPEYVVDNIIKFLNINKKSINGSKILLVGMSYKENISDLRESPSIDIYELLKKYNANVDYCDPLISEFNDSHNNTIRSISLNYDLFNHYDIVVLLSVHEIFDKKLIIKNSNYILDTKNSMKEFNNNNVIKKLGFVNS
ncbi:nucleotide sugar dehydrogenase [Enterococcus sp. AZ137]|uniref:nucleotide sugar dehydrogenase n=1 Tax=Enterococcus sp. AZ137 TaxID=2774965 RepID=UPI003F68501C